ncbi:Dos2-interacting transcription regulator of RNA-Pol-II [Novymonas esmeraldas]|uniref:MMS19 nucleotide excision repair protein n=1 Tax=Novymonas esmeraldas TaxID=1808958 RepID=A0AAW0F5M0_9TRYP
MSIGEHIAVGIAADGVAPEEVRAALRAQSLLSVCTAMREYLCSPDKVQPAMRLLASVSIGRGELSATDVRLLFAFFAEKLAQHECQTTALSSLALLIADIDGQHVCGEEWWRLVAAPFTQHVRVQQLPLNCRRQCFRILSFLFTEKTAGLCDGDTLAALLELVDGESDPELVLQAFDLHVVVASRASWSAFATVVDDYFESVSSYFPVVFSQPPGCKVTKADLRTHLKRCLCLAVYRELCIPFMQGKLASPSTAVKEDVLDVLLTCFETYPSQDLAPYHRSLVLHMKSEVVKLSSFADHASNATLSKCLLMGCEVLGKVSQRCSVKSQSDALEVFGPVVEGFLAALSADPAICSAYATMVFHVLTGAWECCVHVASYLFSMLAMSVEGAERPANAYILFAALASGMLDGLAAFPGVDHAEQLRRSIERTTPLIVGAVASLSLLWRSAEGGAGVDDFTVVCGCEFVVSVLKLSAAIAPWLPDATASDAVDALVWVALHRATGVPTKVCRLLREYAAVDAARVQAALVRLLRSHVAPPEQALTVACELASTSPEALLLAFSDGFVSPACEWMGMLDPAQRASALRTALQHHGGALEGGAADAMAAVLTRDDVAPEFFECGCLVASHLSAGECSRLLAATDSLSLLGVAALVSSRTQLSDTQRSWATAADQFADLITTHVAAWRRVGMDGITGLLMNRLIAAEAEAAVLGRAVPRERRLEIALSVLWGRLLADRAAADDMAVSARGALVASFVAEHLGTAAPVTADGLSAVSEAFSYVPFAATQTADRPSVLELLLGLGVGTVAHPHPALCTALQCLVEQETEERVHAGLADLLELVKSLTAGGVESETAVARTLLFSVDSKCTGSVVLARSVLFHSPTLLALLDGTSGAALVARCRSLNLVASLACGAASLLKDGSPEEKAQLAQARDQVLCATKLSLGDHKRKVRQAAAACRHEWYKVK